MRIYGVVGSSWSKHWARVEDCVGCNFGLVRCVGSGSKGQNKWIGLSLMGSRSEG